MINVNLTKSLLLLYFKLLTVASRDNQIRDGIYTTVLYDGKVKIKALDSRAHHSF